jgi:hypothetical protein
MKVPVLADIVDSTKQELMEVPLNEIYLYVYEDWSILRRTWISDDPRSNVAVYTQAGAAALIGRIQEIEFNTSKGRVMSVMEWVDQCPEPMGWRDDESNTPKGKTWWAVTRMIGGSQATTQFSDFTEAEKYYNTHGENPGTPKQLIKMEVAREWEG